MIISCIGDSLTEGDYGVFGKRGIPNVKAENYPFFLSRLLNCEVRNFGKCGYTATMFLNNYENNNIRVEGSDIIIVLLGTNGGLDLDDCECQGNKDYKMLISLCREHAPEAQIIICTPPHVTSDPSLSGYGNAPKVQKSVDFVRAFADKENILMIDLASCPLFTAETESIMQSNDGVHFSEEGYKALAGYIAHWLKNMGLVEGQI